MAHNKPAPPLLSSLDKRLLAALLAATFAVYAQVAAHQFVNFDDDYYVTDNAHVQAGLSPSSMAWAFKGPHGGNWHPVTTLSHMLDVQLFGDWAGGHHLVSLMLHLANTALLFVWLRRYAGGSWPSFFVAALFALHPQHVESVAWVSSRKDMLSTLFWLLAMFAYGRYAARSSASAYIRVCVFTTLALMAKPMAVTLPFTLLLLDVWPLKRLRIEGGGVIPAMTKLAIEKLPLLGLCLLQGLATLWAQSAAGAMSSLDRISFTARMSNALIAYWEYVYTMIVPIGLMPFYPHRGFDVSIVLPIVALAGLVLVSVLALAAIKKRPELTMGWFWFVITLLPVIGVVQVGSQGMADRYTYVPFIGLFVAIAWTVTAWLESHSNLNKGVAIAGCVVLLLFGALTAMQTRTWRNSVTLWEHAISVNPAVARNWKSLGSAYKEVKRMDDAIAAMERAVQLQPSLPGAHNNLGLAYLQSGKPERAVEAIAKELEQYPDDVMALVNMGNTLISLKRPKEAEGFYAKAATIDPSFEDAYNGLGLAAMVQGKLDEALGQFERCIAINPMKAEAITNIAAVHLQRSDRAKAREYCERALQINPHYPQANALMKALDSKP